MPHGYIAVVQGFPKITDMLSSTPPMAASMPGQASGTAPASTTSGAPAPPVMRAVTTPDLPPPVASSGPAGLETAQSVATPSPPAAGAASAASGQSVASPGTGTVTVPALPAPVTYVGTAHALAPASSASTSINSAMAPAGTNQTVKSANIHSALLLKSTRMWVKPWRCSFTQNMSHPLSGVATRQWLHILSKGMECRAQAWPEALLPCGLARCLRPARQRPQRQT